MKYTEKFSSLFKKILKLKRNSLRALVMRFDNKYGYLSYAERQKLDLFFNSFLAREKNLIKRLHKIQYFEIEGREKFDKIQLRSF